MRPTDELGADVLVLLLLSTMTLTKLEIIDQECDHEKIDSIREASVR